VVSVIPVLQILDGDRESLERRVSQAITRYGADVTVARFTVWYTSRPPVHGAVLRRPADDDAAEAAA